MSVSDEREVLFNIIKFPGRQSIDSYSLSLFSGNRRKLAETVSSLSNDDPGKPIDEGILSSYSGISIGEIFKEFEGCYSLSEESFRLKLNSLIRSKLTGELVQLLDMEKRTELKTGTWGEREQARIRELVHEIDELEKRSNSLVDPSRFLKPGSEIQGFSVEVEYDLADLLPSQAITILHAPGGTGKTWLGLQIGKAISIGTTLFSHNARMRRVIYTDFENPLPVLVERARILDIRDVLFWHQAFDPKPPKLDSGAWQAYKRLPTGSLIIFDTLRAAHDKDENSSEDMAPIMGRLKELRDAGNTILVLHHTSRANDRASKGSTAITDLSDNVLSLHRVRKETYEQIDEDNEPGPDALFRFGTGDKTRFKPAQIFLQRSPTGGFVLADDPDRERLDAIAEYLRKATGPLTQTDIFEWAKDELEIRKKGKVYALLIRGEDTLWNSRVEGKRKLYAAI